MIQTIRQKKSTLAALSLGVLLVSHATALKASDASVSSTSWGQTISNVGAASAVGAIFFTAFRFFSKDSDNNPVRYDFEKLANGEDLLNQSWYLFDDGLVGQQMKKASVKADPESGKVWTSKDTPPKGLIGYAHAYWKSVLSALGVTLVAHDMIVAAQKSNGKLETFTTSFAELMAKRMDQIGLSTAAALIGQRLFGLRGQVFNVARECCKEKGKTSTPSAEPTSTPVASAPAPKAPATA